MWEDAARLGFDHARQWRNLLPKDFRWYAAFHDEGDHPHVHMMAWSARPGQAYLSREGIRTIKSVLVNDIFKQEMLHTYKQKSASRDELARESRRAMRELIRQMKEGVCDCPAAEEKMDALVSQLESVTGKKKYGYLPKRVKKAVDEIVNELERLPVVNRCYQIWWDLQCEIEDYYSEKDRQRPPLSERKEFRVIKNMIVQEAENIQLGTFTFEDHGQRDETDGEEYAAPRTKRELLMAYQEAKAILSDNDTSRAEKEEAVRALEVLWGRGLTVAAHQLGKCWRDGLGVIPDDEMAEAWFKRSADAGNDFSQYALGKLLQEQGRIAESVSWFEKASAQGNQYAAYRLGKLYLAGKEVPKDVARALEYLTASAEAGNQYAQYALGKLYMMGQDVPQDREEARYWLTVSAAQGNEYARFFLDRWDSIGKPSVMLSVTRLLHNIAQTFRAAPMPHDSTSMRPQIDRKLRQRIREKKMAMGHKPDDREEYQGPMMSMRGEKMTR